jgi:hypothetical protein
MYKSREYTLWYVKKIYNKMYKGVYFGVKVKKLEENNMFYTIYDVNILILRIFVGFNQHDLSL